MPIKVLFVSLKSSVRLEEQHQPSPKLRMVTIHSILMAITIPMVITVIPKASCSTLNSCAWQNVHFKLIGIQSWVENFILQRLCGGIRAALLFSLHTSTLWGSVELTFVNKGSTFERSSIVFLLTGKKGTADTRTQCLHLLHQRPKKKKKKAQVVFKPMEMSPWYLSWIKVKEKIKGNDSSKSTCSYLISLYVQNKEKRKLMRHQLKKKSTS